MAPRTSISLNTHTLFRKLSQGEAEPTRLRTFECTKNAILKFRSNAGSIAGDFALIVNSHFSRRAVIQRKELATFVQTNTTVNFADSSRANFVEAIATNVHLVF